MPFSRVQGHSHRVYSTKILFGTRFPTVSRALHSLSFHALGLLLLLKLSFKHSRMSWTFGIKPRAASAASAKGQQGSSEKAIEKLQAYHELAKVQ